MPSGGSGKLHAETSVLAQQMQNLTGAMAAGAGVCCSQRARQVFPPGHITTLCDIEMIGKPGALLGWLSERTNLYDRAISILHNV